MMNKKALCSVSEKEIDGIIDQIRKMGDVPEEKLDGLKFIIYLYKGISCAEPNV